MLPDLFSDEDDLALLRTVLPGAAVRKPVGSVPGCSDEDEDDTPPPPRNVLPGAATRRHVRSVPDLFSDDDDTPPPFRNVLPAPTLHTAPAGKPPKNAPVSSDDDDTPPPIDVLPAPPPLLRAQKPLGRAAVTLSMVQLDRARGDIPPSYESVVGLGRVSLSVRVYRSRAQLLLISELNSEMVSRRM